ncbi:hypothetical protein [Massilia sp. S19_KUP03_FR1]|uniref:hypothetical protein n=1 Tax=Massilia sp. S19_KUP03_FR1 TaxID=3025503 RepID=UPI002FCDBFA7
MRVALPPDTKIDGYIPRPSTGFQVKKPDMPRADIIAEMRPDGVIRPVIQRLGDESGAYIIVSATGSTADSALQNRQNALREGLNNVGNAEQLSTDFYDRTRLASWVRCHPGLISWVKEKIGRASVGWRPYGPWDGATEGLDAEYLLDDKLRLHLGKHRDAPAQSVVQAIDGLRDELAISGKVVRLVGLSGVGKTCLAQVLFDARIGSRPLPQSLAIYTNLSDDPDPQPTGLASDLIANRTRAILIVDNCPPDLHRRLAELCGGKNSTISVLTIEYDVRDDQAERTQVVRLDTSSLALIEGLLRRRYTHLSKVDAHTIADASGGNARIAIALAETVEQSDSISGLSNEELFQRLFRQREDPDNALLLAAQICSLVYSFQGTILAGDEAEIPRLATLAGQTPAETFRHVRELLRRDLVQQRGPWRAVLPHAIANRLAARALEDMPYDFIDQHLISGGTDRLAKSFSRRLSFLHDQPSAIAIVERWLAPEGLLHNVSALNELGRTMFHNVAPVLPEAALSALEQVALKSPDLAVTVWQQYVSLLRSLAYDAPLFERSVQMLSRAALEIGDQRAVKDISDAFVSLFPIYLSGTHATIGQRLTVIERLLLSGQATAKSLGLRALDAVLKTNRFSCGYQFDFGARSRDYGFVPDSDEKLTGWYSAAFELIERTARVAEWLRTEMRGALARNFTGLWAISGLHGQIETLSRAFANDGFWQKGWLACKQTLRFGSNHLDTEGTARLRKLEAELRPSNVAEQVIAIALSDQSISFDLDELNAFDNGFTGASGHLATRARELGEIVGADDTLFEKLLPVMLRGGVRAWTFGHGLAETSPQIQITWSKLVEGLALVPSEQQDVQVLRGFLAELWKRDKDLVHSILDAALATPDLAAFLPVLQTAVDLEERGMARLQQALQNGVPVKKYRYLAYGQVTDSAPAGPFKDLLLLIADQPDGFDIALEILHMRFHSDRSEQRDHEPELLLAGSLLLRDIKFCNDNSSKTYHLTEVIRACLVAVNAGLNAYDVARQLREAVANYKTYSFNNTDLLTVLLQVQPAEVLDALFAGSEDDRYAGLQVFDYLDAHGTNPADVISCETLIQWCSADADVRYQLAAEFVSFGKHTEENASLVWSEQAVALLVGAPAPEKILATFVARFRPTSWSGSRSALIEANSRLLDSMSPLLSSLEPAVIAAKAEIAEAVCAERRLETASDRVQDERFEL